MKAKIKKAKNRYFETTLPNFLKNSPRKFWDYLKPKNSGKTSFTENESHVNADSPNEYFKSVFTVDNGNIPEIESTFPKSIGPITITESGILNLLLDLDTKKATGPDNIPNIFLVRYAELTAKYLCILFNKSLSTGVLPREWKIAKVVPVQKSENSDDVSNFRPISLTCTVCKLLEHVILKHITSFLEKENILSPYQHGFRRALSTVTQLVELTHDISQCLNNQKQIDLIFMDFSKAFDTVSHVKLLRKLENVLGDTVIVNWIKDYLSNRMQYVEFNNNTSAITPVSSGVPQGSVLAPILFLIFINDLPSRVPVNIKLFADDCVVYSVINSIEDNITLQNALSMVCDWCKENQMLRNPKKCSLLTISRKRNISDYLYNINNDPLARVTEHKYLGVTLTADYRWESHINNITSTALKHLFMLRLRLRQAPPQVKLLTYPTYVRSVLEYANIVWAPFTKELINKLERIQRKAVRFIYNRYKIDDSLTELLKQAGLNSLDNRCKIARLKFLFQLVHGHFNLEASNYISVDQTRLTRLKHPQRLIEYWFNVYCCKYNFFPLAIREWNSLGNSITGTTSLTEFLNLVERKLNTM